MAKIEKTVFISYRRKDISWALAVYQYLTGQKYDVFFDYTSLSGGDFEQVIISNIKARAHFILILTPTALDRCDEPGDWIRREIETAVDERRNIIPLFFEGFNFSSPSVAQKLTGKLSAINRYNGLDIPSGYFMEAMERLGSRYLNVPLNAVIHPVSTEVRKVVQEEQNAANIALIQKSEDIKEIVKPAEEVSDERGQEQHPIPLGKDDKRTGSKPNLRSYGIGIAILMVAALGAFGINSLIRNSGGEEAPSPTPMMTYTAVPPSTSTSAPTQANPTDTATTVPPTPVPTLGIGSARTSPKDGMTLLYIPAGEFTMGSDNNQVADQMPAHKVYLDAFWIDQTEVTNKMYSLCVEASICKEPTNKTSAKNINYYGNTAFNNYPVIYVDWNMAETYCAWVDRRLPSEAEWEKAARGDDGRIYPWGNDAPDSNLLNYNNIVGDTSSVKSYETGKSQYGVYDMSGNVWEWVNDWYSETYYSISEQSNPVGPVSGQARVHRGGSFYDTNNFIYSSRRDKGDPGFVSFNLGFRCALSNKSLP
jgi:formylglycine-generating enzyme required for sulfatase activity